MKATDYTLVDSGGFRGETKGRLAAYFTNRPRRVIKFLMCRSWYRRDPVFLAPLPAPPEPLQPLWAERISENEGEREKGGAERREGRGSPAEEDEEDSCVLSVAINL